ncbi:AraC family transcriptional regulator [Tindallia californiensis]|uniref:Transcriptional regulator, AraC family n=1 Tax=Tindallia californiensis TaxID=159292 RepID=A0A1H3Q6Y2_9FIRM|nr:AraC family transcriptional regulator [Tindallia californiensis]SDZ08868.1 transcriptional regulator, AraC family [Tindallia californiensis]
MKNKTIHYIEQINRVQDYIESRLDTPLTLRELSQIANFSEYHFQRIYHTVTGEALYGFIKRIRLEKAAYMLLADPKRPVIDIAMNVGFSSQSSFSKAFKRKYGVSSSCYRRAYRYPKPSGVFQRTLQSTSQNPVLPLDIILREEAPLQLIYTRYTGPYHSNSNLFTGLFKKLYQWADQQHLITEESRWFVLYHDYGYETDEESLRISVCMSVNRPVSIQKNIGIMTLEKASYAVGRFLVSPTEYSNAWNYMYAVWLPNSGCQLADTYSFEHYPPIPMQDSRRFVEIYIPILR